MKPRYRIIWWTNRTGYPYFDLELAYSDDDIMLFKL